MNRLLTMFGVLALVLASVVVAPVSVDAQSTPVSNVVPSVGPRGARFAFYATGFQDGEQVPIWLNDPSGNVVRIPGSAFPYANGDGRADWDWVAPDDAQAGMWQMVARGDESRIEHVISFEVGATEAPDVDANVTPTVGPPGARFDFFARGFTGGERVGIWFNTPDGNVLAAANDGVFYAHNGRVDWFWVAPDDAPLGVWQAVVHGTESGVEWVIPFEIR